MKKFNIVIVCVLSSLCFAQQKKSGVIKFHQLDSVLQTGYEKNADVFVLPDYAEIVSYEPFTEKDEKISKLVLKKECFIDGSLIDSFSVEKDLRFDFFKINLLFCDEGAKLLEEFTSKNVGGKIPIVINGIARFCPVVRDTIVGGNLSLSGLDENEINELVSVLKNTGITEIQLENSLYKKILKEVFNNSYEYKEDEFNANLNKIKISKETAARYLNCGSSTPEEGLLSILANIAANKDSTFEKYIYFNYDELKDLEDFNYAYYLAYVNNNIKFLAEELTNEEKDCAVYVFPDKIKPVSVADNFYHCPALFVDPGDDINESFMVSFNLVLCKRNGEWCINSISLYKQYYSFMSENDLL